MKIFEHASIYPLAKFGFISSFWAINIDTVIYTWVAMATFFLLTFVLRYFFRKHQFEFTIYLKNFFGAFRESIQDALGTFRYDIFEFIVIFFLFVLVCNICSIIPLVEEPTADINTSLAIGLLSFGFVQYNGIKSKGWRYLSKFFEPVFIFLPLNLVTQASKIASPSFRLFGNVLSGVIIFGLLKEQLVVYFPYLAAVMLVLFSLSRFLAKGYIKSFVDGFLNVFMILPFIQIFFGVIHGSFQAALLAMLTIMYVSFEVSAEGGH